MSLAHDRAQAIAAAIRADGRMRYVFLMQAPFRCRVVSVPADEREVLEWVRREAALEVWRYDKNFNAQKLARVIDEAMDRFPVEHRNPLIRQEAA